MIDILFETTDQSVPGRCLYTYLVLYYMQFAPSAADAILCLCSFSGHKEKLVGKDGDKQQTTTRCSTPEAASQRQQRFRTAFAVATKTCVSTLSHWCVLLTVHFNTAHA